MVPNGVPAGFTRDANASLRCMVCQVCCSSVKVVKVHILGKRHRLQSMLLALKTNKDELSKLPKDIGLTCQNVTQTENGDLDCEVALKGHTMLTVTVTNNNDKDALTMQCNLLRDIKANVKQHKSLLKPGESGDVDIKIHGKHLGVRSTALAFKFTWQKQPQDLQQHLNVVRLLRVRCTNDIVTQLQPTTKVSAGQLGHEVQLAQYPVPQYLNRLHSKHLEDSDDVDPELQEQFSKVKNVLTSELSSTNHGERFSLLLHCEEIQMHRDIRNYDMRGVTMTRCRENRRLLTLKVPGLAEKRPSVLKGDWLFVRSCDAKGKADGTKEFKGYVHNTCLNEVWLGFNESFLHNFVENSKFNVRFSVNRYPARMHHRALKLAGNRMNSTLFPTTATATIWEEPKHVNNELTVQNARQHFKDTRLLGNVQQVEAVCNIVSGRSRPTPYLVFGPPGTGKTVTIVEAMKQVLRVVPSAHIMACAPSNSAADLLAERLLLHVPAAQLFRLNAGSRSIITVPECIKACCNIDRHTRAIFYPSKKDLMKYKVIITTLVTAGR
ncbi:putative helicase mov-10-B.2 [Lamellibrachia satsuma]|nr:putative helicase mov-10-B.2 [Lamellibrachia satsuma]